MTKKALNFVVDGMFHTEPSVARERIAYLLNRLESDITDCFTDGFIVGAEITDEQALIEWTIAQNKDKEIHRVEKFEYDGSRIASPRLYATIVYTIYRRENGKNDYDFKKQKTEEYCVEDERATIFTIRLDINAGIPGVKLHIL